jgi:hypothetical protein
MVACLKFGFFLVETLRISAESANSGISISSSAEATVWEGQTKEALVQSLSPGLMVVWIFAPLLSMQ